MDYEQAVKEKMARQKEISTYEKFKSAAEKSAEAFHDLVDDALLASTGYHKFQQSYIEQESFEPRKFLFYKYNKKVRTLKEPTGLCYVCKKLEIEHA